MSSIDIYLHWSFVLLLGWIFLSHVLAGHGLSVATQGVALVATIFACVVLHELGHAFGLAHCRDFGCVMHASTNVGEVDLKRGEFCAACEQRLDERGWS